MTNVLMLAAADPVAASIRSAYPALELADLGSCVSGGARLGVILPAPVPPFERWSEGASTAQWVHFTSTGIDGVPPEWLSGRTVTTTRGSNRDAVADHVLALILAHNRRLGQLWSWNDAHRGYPVSLFDAPLGVLAEQTVGIVGFGEIGSAVARRVNAFGGRVAALRRTSTLLPPEVDMAADARSLAQRSDHLVVLAPLTEDTRGMIDAGVLGALGPTGHLVNAARGELVDQEALVEALAAGRVGAASLDVTTPEPLPASHPLRQADNVHLTPHVAWSGPGITEVRTQMVLTNLGRWLSDEPLLQRVDLAAGY